jgi:TonB family protein
MMKPAAFSVPLSIGLHVAAFAVAAAFGGFSSSLPHYHLRGGGGPVVLEGSFAMAEPAAERAFYLALPPAAEHSESLIMAAGDASEMAPTAVAIQRVRTSIETSSAQIDLPAAREDCQCHAPEGAIQTPKRSLDAPPEFVSSVAAPTALRRQELSMPTPTIATVAWTVATDVPQSPGTEPGGGPLDQLPRKNPANRRPQYPPDAAQRGHYGRVLLEVRVSDRGTVDSLRVVESSGYESLDNAALEGVAEWIFEPAIRGGRPVAAVVNVPINFTPASRR